MINFILTSHMDMLISIGLSAVDISLQNNLVHQSNVEIINRIKLTILLI